MCLLADSALGIEKFYNPGSPPLNTFNELHLLFRSCIGFYRVPTAKESFLAIHSNIIFNVVIILVYVTGNKSFSIFEADLTPQKHYWPSSGMAKFFDLG